MDAQPSAPPPVRLCNREQSKRAGRGTLVGEGVTMLNGLTRTKVIQIWLAVVLVATAVGVVFGVAMTLSTGILLLASALVPPAIVFMLWRDEPPTAAEMIHSADRRS
jgi:1,4-dihydroxy-2-naphthoate octaprenyltransferase